MDTQILFFSAPWCGPCRMMKSTLNESVRDDLNIKVIDISEDMDTATKYQVMNVPTFVKLIDGKEVARKIGSTTIETLKTL